MNNPFFIRANVEDDFMAPCLCVDMWQPMRVPHVAHVRTISG